MKAIVKYTLETYQETINLVDLDIDENRNWDDLTEDEQNEIRDYLLKERRIIISIENYE